MSEQQQLAKHYLEAEALSFRLSINDVEPSSGMAALERQRQILRRHIIETAKPMHAPWPEPEDASLDVQSEVQAGAARTQYFGYVVLALALVAIAWKGL